MTEQTIAQGETWDIPREEGKRYDPLLECLMALTRIHGCPRTRDSLISGLPLVDHVLIPSIFDRAARRAGLVSKIVKRELASLNEALLPVILLLKDRNACLLLGWESDGSARVAFPELGESASILSREELEARYTGTAIFCRPRFRFDKRAPEVGKVRQRHWFWSTLLENMPVYKDILFAAFLINLFGVALPIFIRLVYDRVVPNNAIETLWVMVIGLLIIMVADVSLRLMRGYLIDVAGSRVDVELSAKIMERVLGIRMENRPVSVGAMAANMRAFDSVRDFIASATVTTLIDLPFALIFLTVMALIDWVMVLPGLIGISAVIGYALLMQERIHALSETTQRAGSQRNASLVESLVGLETVKAIGAEGIMQRKWEQGASFLARTATQMRLLAAATVNVTSTINQLVFISVIILGVYRIGGGYLTLGGMIACAMLSGRAMGPLNNLASLLVNYHKASTALKTMEEVMTSAIERPPDANFVSRSHFNGDIEFSDVHFAYPGVEREALTDVSFKISAGEHVAIIGRIGSGKSTILKLILGLYQPTGGTIRIDGVDIRQLDPAELRRSVGYAPQDGTLFYGSLRDNIVLTSPEVDDTVLLAAAEVGGLADMVNRHPRGFDMMVGERGESLSGGQRQGVSIARAVINSPPILLLDEPTGSMDSSSEDEVKQRLREYGKGKTIVVVTHRTSLLDLVDRIIVVDHGKVVADGPKASVIEALKRGRIERAK